MALLGVLPTEGNFLDMKVLHDLRMHLALTEEENKLLNIRQSTMPDGRTFIEWDVEAATKADKEIPIGEIGQSIIVKTLKELNEKEHLNAETFLLYDKFVESKR
jgi:hypothetical protein